jgi:transposase
VGKVPPSAHGRIKVLTTYGMTVEDVADLYGVSASEIDRIVARTPP